MFVRRRDDSPEIVANDGCRLRELLHPDRGASGIPYSLALAWVGPGQATFPHRLTGETEVYLVLGGSGRMHVGREMEDVCPGDAVVIPAGAEQWIECTGAEPLHFATIVSPPWRMEHDVRTGSGEAPFREP